MPGPEFNPQDDEPIDREAWEAYQKARQEICPNKTPAGERERAEFEAWANAKGTMGKSWNSHYYENPLHEAAWQSWQAARREERKRILEEAKVKIAEQRCERGTPYDLGVMAAYEAVSALEKEG